MPIWEGTKRQSAIIWAVIWMIHWWAISNEAYFHRGWKRTMRTREWAYERCHSGFCSPLFFLPFKKSCNSFQHNNISVFSVALFVSVPIFHRPSTTDRLFLSIKLLQLFIGRHIFHSSRFHFPLMAAKWCSNTRDFISHERLGALCWSWFFTRIGSLALDTISWSFSLNWSWNGSVLNTQCNCQRFWDFKDWHFDIFA